MRRIFGDSAFVFIMIQQYHMKNTNFMRNQ